MHADYTGQGVDQLAEVIQKIKNSPDDRRIILCAWNPKGEDTAGKFCSKKLAMGVSVV